MGQYYKVINVDKKEMLIPWKFDCGAKLMEWSYGKNDMVLALMNLLDGSWKGDRVYVVGDYAEDDDKSEACYETLKGLIDELNIRGQMVDGYRLSLYGYASEHFKDISGNADIDDHGYRYIYNHELKKVIDLQKCPIEWIWWNKDEKRARITSISPLSLLLAMGNDRGCGDFHSGNNGYEHIGTWCSTSQHIEVTKEPIEGIDYEEFAPDFTEQDEIVPYTESEKKIKEFEKKFKEREEKAQ